MKAEYLLIPLLLWVLAGPGCTPVLVGGAAAGGYYVGKDERSVSEIASDGRITTAINARFVRDEDVKARNIDVDTYRGVVTLQGSVPSHAVADRAVYLARTTKGVVKVVNKLTVTR